MIEGTAITVVIISLLLIALFNKPYPRLFRQQLINERIAKQKARLKRKHKKEIFHKLGWKYSDDMDIEIIRKGIKIKGGFSGKPSLKARAKRYLHNRNTKTIAKIVISIAITAFFYYLTHIPIPFFFGVTNTWDNSDADNVYSNGNNWSLGHKPATTEDIVIPDTSGIGKCTMDENSAADLATLTVQTNGELEAVSYTLDANGDITLTGTFTCGTGTIQLGGGGGQDVTSGGNTLYHIVITGANTAYNMIDDTEIYDADVQTDASFLIDAVSANSDLTLTYTSTGGFLASAGALTLTGDVTYQWTITGSSYWDMDTPSLSITADYGTFDHFYTFRPRGGTQNIDNCTFQDYDFYLYFWGCTLSSFDNNTIDHSTGYSGWVLPIFGSVPPVITNLTILNADAADVSIQIDTYSSPIEFVNCIFDISKVDSPTNSGQVVSKNHGGVANNYHIWLASSDTLTKSGITNDFGASDNVTVQGDGGIFSVNEDAAHANFTVSDNSTLTIAAGVNWTITATKTVTIESGSTLNIHGACSAGNRVTIRSSINDTAWNLDLQTGSSHSVYCLDIRDCDASAGDEVQGDDSCWDEANNINWDFGDIIVIAEYDGTSDASPQVFANSSGHLVAFYGTRQVSERVYITYSTDGGATWSTPTPLFSTAGQGDGIIDDDVPATMTTAGEVYNDVLYLVVHVDVGGSQVSFMKCDISTISNVDTFSNWKSADGTPVPSEGGGSDGNGYDMIIAGSVASITVKSPGNILINHRAAAAGANMLLAHWDGSTWTTGTGKTLPENILTFPKIQRTQTHWIAALGLDAADGNDYMVVLKCPTDSDVFTTDNWTGMDGLGDFDYVIDTGDGAFHWPYLQVDSNNYVHVVSLTSYLIDSYLRAFHNYWTGSSWVNGETENSAGSQIVIDTDYPQIYFNTAPRTISLNADSDGNIIALLGQKSGADGDGLYSTFWSGSWGSLTKHGRMTYDIVSEGYMRGVETSSPFLIREGITDFKHLMSFLNVTGATSGNPWWDEVAKPAGGGPNTKLILPLELS